MLPVVGLLIAISCAGQSESGAVREAPEPTLLSGSRFHVELERPLSGTWSHVELRSVLNKITNERRISILLDRRIDPTVQLPISMANLPLREGLLGIARLAEAGVSVSEPVVYMGPLAATRRLRTLIELRSNELRTSGPSISEKRAFELSQRHTCHWQDLDTPGDIVQRIAERYRLTVRNGELIRHDLWAGNTLPSVNATEALSLVLIQFDLTFAWIDAGQGVELVSIPKHILLERRHRAKGRSASELVKLIKQRWPSLDIQSIDSDLIVRGTVEDHEGVTALLSGSSRKPATITGPAPIRQRQFTLKIERVPVRDLMKKLEESDIVFEYDSGALKSAGIDLDQTIRLEIEKASAEEFFTAVFDPLRLSVEIDNLTVRLTPKK